MENKIEQIQDINKKAEIIRLFGMGFCDGIDNNDLFIIEFKEQIIYMVSDILSKTENVDDVENTFFIIAKNIIDLTNKRIKGAIDLNQIDEMSDIVGIDLVEDENISEIYEYHLIYSNIINKLMLEIQRLESVSRKERENDKVDNYFLTREKIKDYTDSIKSLKFFRLLMNGYIFKLYEVYNSIQVVNRSLRKIKNLDK